MADSSTSLSLSNSQNVPGNAAEGLTDSSCAGGQWCGASASVETQCTVKCPKPPVSFPNCQGVQPVISFTECGPCCWDMSLCTTCPPSCSSGTDSVSISLSDSTEVPAIAGDVGAYLSIYNYAVQRFVTRSLKFVTAYYDFVGGMLNSSSNNKPGNNYRDCCGGDPSGVAPSPAYPSQVKDRVFQAWQWVWERLQTNGSWDLFCEPDCLLQPVLTLLTLSGGENAAAFKNALLKNSFSNLTASNALGCIDPVQVNGCCDTNQAACQVAIGTLGGGRDYDDSQFHAWGQEVVNVIDIIETILDSLDISDDTDSAEKLLFKICDCYIKCACCGNPSGSPQDLTGTCGPCQLGFNRCGKPYLGRQVITPACSTYQIVRNTYAGDSQDTCLSPDGKYVPGDIWTPGGPPVAIATGDDCSNPAADCCVTGDVKCAEQDCSTNGALYIPSTRERLQAAIFVLDWIAFLLFDRDADKSQFSDTSVFSSGNCFCPDWTGEDGQCVDCNAPGLTESEWLKRRCKLGTGNGSCVVAAGACKGFRQVDDFKPMQTMLISFKHFITLLTISPDNGYQDAVTDTYNSLISSLQSLYVGENELTFNNDCAAPQFCCTTNWTQAGRILAGNRAGVSSSSAGCCQEFCVNPCACCNLTIPEYTVQCFARLKCSCQGPLCEQPVPRSCPYETTVPIGCTFGAAPPVSNK